MSMMSIIDKSSFDSEVVLEEGELDSVAPLTNQQYVSDPPLSQIANDFIMSGSAMGLIGTSPSSTKPTPYTRPPPTEL